MIIQDQAMRIIEASERNSDLLEKLVIIWEGSVRATHLFLSDEEIEDIKKVCLQGFAGSAAPACERRWKRKSLRFHGHLRTEGRNAVCK